LVILLLGFLGLAFAKWEREKAESAGMSAVPSIAPLHLDSAEWVPRMLEDENYRNLYGLLYHWVTSIVREEIRREREPQHR